jgi:hypothetical protein
MYTRQEKKEMLADDISKYLPHLDVSSLSMYNLKVTLFS